ncbi:MAG: uracil-DNA glycosylase [Deltaproteobacteria bacterium]|nr:uracil-DNA glycosylase [Deltaproteobacteria bacterium]
MNRKQAVNDIVAEIDNTLKFMEGLGCRGFDCSAKSLDTLEKWGSDVAIADETLESIRTDIGNCKRCTLCQKRTNIVFGAGDPKARLVFVGEGPGYEEDKSGEPFVGAAGKLLTKIIEAIHLTREKVYICNIIKCRPPGNRNPMPDEIKTCFPFLKRQLLVMKPDFICALGTFAAQTLLETKQPISRLRGHFHDYMGIKVMPTYHPAYLLRNANKKREVWEDMKVLIEEMK